MRFKSGQSFLNLQNIQYASSKLPKFLITPSTIYCTDIAFRVNMFTLTMRNKESVKHSFKSS